MFLASLLLACAPTLFDDATALDTAARWTVPVPVGDAPPLENPPDVTYSDALRAVGADGPYHGADFAFDDDLERRYDLIDAVALDADTALIVGRPGYLVTDLDDGAFQHGVIFEDLFDVALDEEIAVAWTTAAYSASLYPIDVADPRDPQLGDRAPLPGVASDVAAGGGLVLVAGRGDGGLLFDAAALMEAPDAEDAEGEWIDGGPALRATIPAENALAVAIEGDRALLSDGDALLLLDLSFPDTPVVLDTLFLAGAAYDLALSGAHAAAALGSAGVQVIGVEGDRLTDRGALETFGATFSVAIDEDTLWAAAWYHTAAFDLAPDGVASGPPRALGHESSLNIAIGVGAGFGRAIVADWSWSTALERVGGDPAPEIVVERDYWMSEPGGRLTIPFANGGAAPLTITLSDDDALGCSVAFTPNALTIAPGERITVEARLPAVLADTMCRWTSNDPDEALGWLDLRVPSQSLGQPHEDFELMGFTAPDTRLTPYQLSDQRGQVVVLFFFAPL